MTLDLLPLAGLFLLAATIYSMAGFGGGSAYLAMLTLAGVPIAEVAVVALVCNVIVVAGGSWLFARAGHLRLRLLLPFVLTSVPAAFLGGRLALPAGAVHLIMGVALAGAGVVLLLNVRPSAERGVDPPSRRAFWPAAGAMGASLGGLAGVIGIGGGIFLAPALHLLRWGTARQIAAVASAFILLNSLAGLAGKATHAADPALPFAYAPLFAAVLVGGQIGSRLSARRLSGVAIRRVTAVVVLFAALNLLMRGIAG